MIGMNPIKIVDMLRNGQSPQAMATQMMNNNPAFKNIYENLSGKTNQEMKEYAENLAKERGINLNDLASKIGLNLPD